MSTRIYVPAQRCPACTSLGYQCAEHRPPDRMRLIKFVGAVIATLFVIMAVAGTISTLSKPAPHRSVIVNGVTCVQATPSQPYVCPR
jgi:hypothetical protein